MKNFILCIVLLLSPVLLYSQKLSNGELLASVTYMFESDNLYFSQVDRYYTVGDAFIFKAEGSYFFDSFSKKFGIGVYGNFGSPWYDGNEETGMTEVGAVFKWRLNSGQLLFVPSLYVGYRSYADEAGEGLGVNFSVLCQFPLEKMTPFVDIGFLSQPTGGNDAYDITYSPVFIVGGGISFGL